MQLWSVMQNVANSVDLSTVTIPPNQTTEVAQTYGAGACDDDFNTNSLRYCFIVHSLAQDKSADLAAKSQ